MQPSNKSLLSAQTSNLWNKSMHVYVWLYVCLCLVHVACGGKKYVLCSRKDHMVQKKQPHVSHEQLARGTNKQTPSFSQHPSSLLHCDYHKQPSTPLAERQTHHILTDPCVPHDLQTYMWKSTLHGCWELYSTVEKSKACPSALCEKVIIPVDVYRGKPTLWTSSHTVKEIIRNRLLKIQEN